MSYGTAPPLSGQEPQGQQPGRPDLRTALQEYVQSTGAPDFGSALEEFAMARGRQISEEAQGPLEHAKFLGLGAVKAFADASAHAGVLGAKALSGAASWATGQGFDPGWDAIEQQMMSDTGTVDPDALDIIKSIGRKLGVVDDPSMLVGQKADELIQRRLGNWAILSQTAGTVGAFMTGPGANIGRGAAATVKPVSMLGERILARAAGKGAPSFEAGRVWDWMAETPQWLATAGLGQRMLAAGGRSFDDLLSVTAANVAQSYALSPDDARKRAAWIAAETSWLMLPIARIGQGLAGHIAAGNLTPAQARAAKLTYDQLADGGITYRQADKQFKELLSGTRMATANLVSGATEGLAFMGITPEAHDLARQYMAGDSDAGAKLLMMWMGTVSGVVVGKYAVPQELAPLFKHVRPDLNRLSTYIEAEANARAGETLPEQPKPDADAALDAEIAAGQRPLDEQEFRAWEAKQQRDFENRQRIEQHFDQSEIATRAQYGWAIAHTVAALRGGWEPEFVGGTRDVVLHHGRDFDVRLTPATEPTSAAKPIKWETAPGDRNQWRRDMADAAQSASGNPVTARTTPEQAQRILKFVPSKSPLGQQLASVAAGRDIVAVTVDAADMRRFAKTWAKFAPRETVSMMGRMAGTREAKPSEAARSENAPFVQSVDSWLAKIVDEMAGQQREFTVVLDDKAAAALAEAGRDRGIREAHGSEAHRILDDLALLAAGRQQQGDLTYTRLGMREVKPGVWADDGRDLYFTMQLDGSSATKDPLSSKWTGREDVVTVAGYGEPKWDHPNVGALADMLAAKEALAPDPLVDGILAQAIQQARYSNSIGAGQLRALFAEMPPDVMRALIKPGTDDYLALLLGSLGSGHSNAPATALELAQPQPEAGVARARGTNEPRIEGSVEPVAPFQAKETAAPRIEEVATQPTLSERLDPGDLPPEPGSTMEAGAMGGAVVKQAGRTAGKAAAQVGEEVFTTYADRLQKAVPNDPDQFVGRGRLAESEGAALEQRTLKAAAPAEKAARKLGAKWTRQVVPLDPQNPTEGTVPAWVEVADALTPGRNARERQFQAGMQAASRTTWEAGIEAGMVRPQRTSQGKVELRPMEPRARATTQRFMGKDADEVFGTDALRQAMFDVWAKHNPTVMVPDGQGGQRRITGADIEAQWVTEQGKAKVDLAENESAIEFMRQFQKVPYTFRGKEVFETSPFKVLERLAHEQSARVAVAGQFGQPVPTPVRQALIKELKASGKSPKALQALEQRHGIEEAVSTFAQRITNTGDARMNQKMQEVAREWADLLQARRPKNLQLPAGLAMRGLTGVEGFARTMLTAVKTGVLDIPEMATLGITHFSAADTWKALGSFFKNPREAIRYAYETSVIDRDMADHNWVEARGIVDKLQAGVQFTNNLLEHAKGAVLVKIVDQSIARMKAKSPTINDRQVVRDLLRLSPQQEQALLNGTASPQVYQLYRRAATRFMSAKEGMAGGSRFAASRPLNTLFRFARWSSRRIGNQIKVMVAVQRAAKDHGWNSRQTAQAYWRAGKLMGMNVVGGVLGQALGYALVDAFSGENGFKRYWNTLTYAPFATIGKAFGAQVLMGPVGQLVGAAMDQDNARAWASMTSVTSALYALYDAGGDLLKGDLASGLYKFGAGMGAVPLRREIGDSIALVHAWANGANKTIRGDAKAVNTWKRMEKIAPSYGPKNKPDEFYDAVSRILTHVDNNQGSDKAALQAAMDDIRQALSLAPEESVAGAVRGHQLVAGLSPEQRHDLAELVNDDARMTRIYQHDEALRQLARKIDKMEGTNPTPLARELELVTQQARTGASDKWRGIAERAVENATQRLLAGEAIGSEIDEVAMAMAQFPQQLGSMLPERTFRLLNRPDLDTTARARRIAALLRSRTKERRQAALKERAQEARDGR